MNATQILESKGIDSEKANGIVYETLDMQVRKLFNVNTQPVHLWESYTLGDAGEDELLACANELKCNNYENYSDLCDDMTIELERLAGVYLV